MRSSAILLLTAAILPASILHSQIIPIKSVPLAHGQQFLLHPSENRLMGGGTLTLDDSLADPYRNPAAGALVRGVRISASPMHYNVDLGSRALSTSAVTVPVSVLIGGDRVFGGFSWAGQSLTTGGGSPPTLFPIASPMSVRESHSNMYVFGMIGMKFPVAGLSAGVSVFRANLNAMDGVQHLYPSSGGLTQRGTVSSWRLGLRGVWEDARALDMVIAQEATEIRHMMLSNRYDGWIPFDFIPVPPSIRTEEDRTLATGVHIGYRQPLNETWMIGGMFAGTMKTHPKIPNYELMNIPRDPGTSTAWNLGVGLSTRGVSTVFGVDFIYEPVTSETWAEYEPAIVPYPVPILHAGRRSVENFFDFSNYHLRFGVRSRVRDLGIGLRIHRIAYDLKQIDHRAATIRYEEEAWTEVTFSLGFGFDLLGGHVKYLGLADFGTGRPGTDMVRVVPTATYETAGNFLIAPQGSLRLDEALVLTHQLSFIITFD